MQKICKLSSLHPNWNKYALQLMCSAENFVVQKDINWNKHVVQFSVGIFLDY
jgi:hypothetical protein